MIKNSYSQILCHRINTVPKIKLIGIWIVLLTLSLDCFSQTQTEMNKEAFAKYNKADKLLNDVYQQVVIEYEADTIFVECLKKSQRIWLKFRDAELEMKYPHYPDNHYGTIQPTCRASYLMELTKKRIKTQYLRIKIRLDPTLWSIFRREE